MLESAAQGDRVAAVLATTSLAALSVPATLHASLMARLDRLGPAAKEIAQIGAVLGREFGYELIEPVAQRPERELQAALDQLGDAGLLFCRGTAPHASYLFKHALVQDAAYSTLLRGRRQELHARVAAALEAAFRRSRRAPAGTARPSSDRGRRHRARRRSMAEGRPSMPPSDWPISKRSPIFERGLAHWRHCPEGPASRIGSEIELQLASAASVCSRPKASVRQRRRIYARARELAERQRRAAPTVRGALWAVAVDQWQGRDGRAAAHSPTSLLSTDRGEATMDCGSRRITAPGRRGLLSGEPAEPRVAHARPAAASTIRRRASSPSLSSMAGTIPGACAGYMAAQVEWLLGLSRDGLWQASPSSDTGRAHGAHPFTLGATLSMRHASPRSRRAGSGFTTDSRRPRRWSAEQRISARHRTTDLCAARH